MVTNHPKLFIDDGNLNTRRLRICQYKSVDLPTSAIVAEVDSWEVAGNTTLNPRGESTENHARVDRSPLRGLRGLPEADSLRSERSTDFKPPALVAPASRSTCRP